MGPRLAQVLILIVAAVVAFAIGDSALREPAAMDFVAQYAAARLVLDGRGGAILDPTAIQAAEHAAAPARIALLPFVQPPAIALLLAPLAALPFTTAFSIVAAIDALLIVVALALMRPVPAGLAFALLLLAPPAAVAVAQGQTAPLALALVAVSLRARPRVSGLALGLTLLRPQTAPLLLLAGFVDASRRVWTALGAAVVVGASAAVVGLDGLARYVAILLDASQWSVTGELGLSRSIGWAGLLAPVGAAGWSLALSLVALALGAAFVIRGEPASRPRVAAAWSLIASPHVLMHDAVLAYPALVALRGTRFPWIGASVAAWTVHLVALPIAALWSLAMAIRAPYARARE